MRRFVLALAVLAVASACSKKTETATPVATPAVTLSTTQVAVGRPLDVTYRFTVASNAPPFAADETVFVHFLDNDGELLWTDDHQPPTPARQWKPGQTIEYTRTVFVPKVAYTGEVGVDVGLYSPQSGARQPLNGQDTGMRAYRVAAFTMNLQADDYFVIFRDGWHDAEVGDAGSGLEWQWSRKVGTLGFRNPRRDAILLLQLDQPIALTPPQQVEVRIGSTVVDRFALPAGERMLRRIALTPAQLGEADSVDASITVDRTMIPATMPELKSSDARELGVRVFRALVEPK